MTFSEADELRGVADETQDKQTDAATRLVLVKPCAVSEAYHYLAVPLGLFDHDDDDDVDDDDVDDDDVDDDDVDDVDDDGNKINGHDCGSEYRS